ncbi:hypothetical protein JWG41_17525 [Leptospira sp. 201903075]|uniref:hypothetical protein n=1 Tax=Leptospira chreensis TaxID=2810035 RepID=UPI0019638BDE|nr:hypothetical protein [Leptospira chreensis]MBM9592249.1 hypothetical protein [Leptospira chreensis]
MLKYLVWLPLLALFIWSCSHEKEEGLIPGTRLTGDPMADALVLSVLATPPCQYLTNENASVPFVLDGSISICSVLAVPGSLSVTVSGNYEVTAVSGRQTLTSNNCNSSRFDFLVSLKDGNTELFSSTSAGAKQIVLETGKLYALQSTGLVDPSAYQCQGRPVSSAVTPYRINLRRL